MAQQINDSLYRLNAYIDASMQPVTTFADLASFSNMFNGLTAVVINGELPVTFQYAGNDTKKYFWVIKKLPVFPTFNDLSATTSDIVTTLSTKKNASRAFYVGLEATIQVGEGGGIEKYIVTEVINGVPTWELEVNSGRDLSTDPETIAEMLNTNAFGNVVYATGPVYSYESGDTVVYTADQAEASGQTGYTEYPAGQLYSVTADSNGETVLADIISNNKNDGWSFPVIGDDANG